MERVEFRILSVDAIPGRTSVVAVVEVVRGALHTAESHVFREVSSANRWRLDEIALSSPPHPTRMMLGLTPLTDSTTLRRGLLLQEERDETK